MNDRVAMLLTQWSIEGINWLFVSGERQFWLVPAV
jgi:hypothetical protein